MPEARRRRRRTSRDTNVTMVTIAAFADVGGTSGGTLYLIGAEGCRQRVKLTVRVGSTGPGPRGRMLDAGGGRAGENLTSYDADSSGWPQAQV
jgi:hypothetical protein